MKKYNKLVRDKIPEIISAKGKVAFTHIADGGEYFDKLKDKLREEVDEFISEPSCEELADVLEVVEAIAYHKGYDRKEIERVKVRKRNGRGGFRERIILERVG